MGRLNRKTFRLVVTDKSNPRDGKYIEMLGWYNPYAENEKNLFIKSERILFWLQKGAQLSQNAKCLIKKADAQVIQSLQERKKIKKTKKRKKLKKNNTK